MPRRAKGDGYTSWDDERQRWRATVTLPTGGTRTRYFGGGHQTKAGARREAESWRREQIEALRDGRDLKAADQKVSDALSEMIGGMDYLRTDTIGNYRGQAIHIGDAVGDMPVKTVQAFDVERMDRANRLTMTREVANAILTLLNKLYKRLIATRVVSYNPVAAYMEITPPKARMGKALRDPVALDSGMVRRVLRELDGDAYQLPILYLFALGFRAGELRGLRHANIFDDYLSIVEQRRKNDPHTPAALKTEDEIGQGRDLPYPDRLRLLTPPGDDLVFPASDGGSIRPSTLRNHFNAALKRARAPHIHIHDTRHTAASNLLRMGCPERYVAEFLGHKPGTKSPLLQFKMTSHYARPGVDALRPWVEQWLDLILPESLKIKLAETGT